MASKILSENKSGDKEKVFFNYIFSVNLNKTKKAEKLTVNQFLKMLPT